MGLRSSQWPWFRPVSRRGSLNSEPSLTSRRQAMALALVASCADSIGNPAGARWNLAGVVTEGLVFCNERGVDPIGVREAGWTLSGTRIASVSGLRGVVGDGLDPAAVVEFAAAYASSCAAGPIVVGHDGRVSASVFLPAVLAGITGTGRDVLLIGAAATPTLGRLVRDQGAAGGLMISASHNHGQVQRLEVLPAGRHGAWSGAWPRSSRAL